MIQPAVLVLAAASCVAGSQPTPPGQPAAAAAHLDWRRLEAPLLRRHVQVTSRERFVRAGEAYFSHDNPPTWIIFQAVPVPEAGKEPDPFYAMYIARLRRSAEGRVTGIEEPIRVSPPGSANTCGWFDPVRPGRVIFGSTLVRPKDEQRSGFSVQGRRYVWMFPEEMEVVECQTPAAAGGALGAPAAVFSRQNYDAECSYSSDGRFILYAHVRDEPTRGRPDADIFVYDTRTGAHHPLVTADGYDGGPFFSPDGRFICYRSDRKGDDLLQLFIAELLYNDEGVPVGVKREHQITDDSNVNWAPYWHPSGRVLVYGTSAQGHQNYEVYAIQADESVFDLPASEVPRRRVTFADGADVLPAFSDDGRLFMWTAQRGPLGEGEARPSSQLWIADCTPGGFDTPGALFLGDRPDGLNMVDAEQIARATMLERGEAWAERATFSSQRLEDGAWYVRARHPSRKKGEDRLITVGPDGEVTAYHAY
jgi:hypothetical protein